MISTKNLSKIYGEGSGKVEALNNINLDIKKGEFVAIVGASGSGKSTLLHLLAGVDIPSSGQVIINNQDIYSLKEKELSIFRRRNIGLVFQSYNLIPVLTVEENIEIPSLLDGRNCDKNYLDELINTLGLKERLDHLPSQLSGGQQQRVSIGRALINKPAIILADEPTGNLDSETSKEIMELLSVSAKKFNQTLILITHDLSVAEEADRIIKIKDGKIVE